ncbi:fused MFS/spermidine synthase [Rhizobacter sp. SG703]|uniref:fused MFS/spermidine synthase n=1 Tax=Rhizobacter sp. SG703 TaxID=2587140 RepID=UPI0014478077|nr:fused MFS/spermidine synthase [Rhizobacter sp. SG703]NKI93287.1 spermidine synthase [Rhizobacter sp. SG703]
MTPPDFPMADDSPPLVRATLDAQVLQFSDAEIQSRMRLLDPHALDLQYTQLMMGFLMFIAAPTRVAMIGLGGGSIAKFCHRHLRRTRLDVAEINPQVIALRDRFHLPPDDDRLSVLQVDGARFVSETAVRYDALLVDGFDRHGLPRQLCSQRFYDDCADALQPTGVLAANLHANHAEQPVWLERIGRSFGHEPLVVHDDDRSNCVVFASRVALRLAPGTSTCPPGLASAGWPPLADAFRLIVSRMGIRAA